MRRVAGRSRFQGMIVALLLCPAPCFGQGAAIAAQACAACHGDGGASLNAIVPTLAGQPYTLIEDNLLAFRAGKRSCSPARADESPAAALALTMCALVADLSDREIAGLADFYSSRDFAPAAQAFDAQLAARGAELHRQLGCDRCHARGGRETLGMAPRLAGQWTPFLRRALQAVKSGTRTGPREMNPPIRGLAENELEALLNFYAANGQE